MANALLIYNPAAGRVSTRPPIGGIVHILSNRTLFREVQIESDTSYSIRLGGELLTGAQKVMMKVLPRSLPLLNRDRNNQTK